MKKFALTAIAAAMFSGAVSAETIKIPDGYRVDTAANGIITVMKKGEDGQYRAFEYHTVKEDMVLEHSDGYQVIVKSAGDNYDTYKEHTDKWNAENKGHAAGDGTANDGMNHNPLPDFGNGEAGIPERPFPGTGLPERPLPGTGEGSVERPQPGNGIGSIERPQPGQDNRPGAGSGVNKPFPGENNRPFPGTGEEKPFPGQGDRPFPGTGEGSVERPQPGNGVGSVERPRPGQGEGSVERPHPGENNRPQPEVDGSQPRPTPNLSGGINQNKDHIQQIGDAFKEYVIKNSTKEADLDQKLAAVNNYLNQAGSAIGNNAAGIQNNSNRIDELKNSFEQQAAHTAKEISRLDGRIDGIGAMSQAVTAARPQLFGNQTSAIGMGIGHMGDATALAAGYVHRINENWSANANIATTFGTDNNDTSVGAGVAYAW